MYAKLQNSKKPLCSLSSNFIRKHSHKINLSQLLPPGIAYGTYLSHNPFNVAPAIRGKEMIMPKSSTN